MPRRRVLPEDGLHGRMVAAGIMPNQQVSDRVEVISEEEERKLRAAEQKALQKQYDDAQKANRAEMAAAAKGVPEMSEAKLKAEAKKLYAENADLEAQWKALKDKARENVRRISALENEAQNRKKAGWLTATIGGPDQAAEGGPSNAHGLGVQ